MLMGAEQWIRRYLDTLDHLRAPRTDEIANVVCATVCSGEEAFRENLALREPNHGEHVGFVEADAIAANAQSFAPAPAPFLWRQGQSRHHPNTLSMLELAGWRTDLAVGDDVEPSEAGSKV